LLIRPFESRDQDVVRRLVLAGLGEHFGWIDETRNPDLDNITANYTERGHVFVVAEINGEIVGAAALVTEDANTGRIVRMSVKQTHRRQGIGCALVMHLLNVAHQQGFMQVCVSTEPDWHDAIKLYTHCGFKECDRDDVDIFFVLHFAES
jgi:N-acetylglutamate synthase-like GNAT family acetyltransferase